MFADIIVFPPLALGTLKVFNLKVDFLQVYEDINMFPLLRLEHFHSSGEFTSCE